MSKPQKRCIFCSGTGMSKEDIWGRWLKDHLNINQPKHMLGTLIVNAPGIPNERNERIRTGDPIRSKVRVVCTTCNNTWMSRIQNATKPHLVPMLDGRLCVLCWKIEAELAGSGYGATPDELAAIDEGPFGEPASEEEVSAALAVFR